MKEIKHAIGGHGFTLVELMVAVTILVIIGGSSYTVFNMALNVYKESEGQIMMNQKCRISLDRISTDLVNMQAVQGDEALTLISVDNPSEEGERDVISFVTLIHTDPDPFLTQLNAGQQDSFGNADEENQQQLVSDVQRVAYYMGPDPTQQEETEFRGTMFREDEENESPVLLRITTTSLEPEVVIQPLIENGSIPSEDEEGNPIYADVQTISDRIAAFDLKYFDGEEWFDSWEDTETIPTAVQILITVAEQNNRQNQQNQQTQQNVQPNSVTQSTMVYLLMSANFSEQAAGGGGPGG